MRNPPRDAHRSDTRLAGLRSSGGKGLTGAAPRCPAINHAAASTFLVPSPPMTPTKLWLGSGHSHADPRGCLRSITAEQQPCRALCSCAVSPSQSISLEVDSDEGRRGEERGAGLCQDKG